MARNSHGDRLEELRHSSRLQMLNTIQYCLVDISKDSYIVDMVDISKDSYVVDMVCIRSSNRITLLSGARTISHFMLPLHVGNSLDEFTEGLTASATLHWYTACSLFVNSFKVFNLGHHHAQVPLNQFGFPFGTRFNSWKKKEFLFKIGYHKLLGAFSVD